MCRPHFIHVQCNYRFSLFCLNRQPPPQSERHMNNVSHFSVKNLAQFSKQECVIRPNPGPQLGQVMQPWNLRMVQVLI